MDQPVLAEVIRLALIHGPFHTRTVRDEVQRWPRSRSGTQLAIVDMDVGEGLTSIEQIPDNLWGVDYATESNVIERHVRNLRTKLQDDWRRPRFIATVPGRGYRFVPTAAGASGEETS